MRYFTLLIIVLVFTGCASAPKYVGPDPSSASKTSVNIARTYDETWSRLIQYASQRFFAIDDYEKESGLMTLSFSGDPNRFINCGTVGTGSDQKSYVDWWNSLSYASADFSGRMNIVVQEEAEENTLIEVSTRYVFTVDNSQSVFEWVFNTGGSDTLIAPPAGLGDGAGGQRTCRPTHQAERLILEGVRKQ